MKKAWDSDYMFMSVYACVHAHMCVCMCACINEGIQHVCNPCGACPYYIHVRLNGDAAVKKNSSIIVSEGCSVAKKQCD